MRRRFDSHDQAVPGDTIRALSEAPMVRGKMFSANDKLTLTRRLESRRDTEHSREMLPTDGKRTSRERMNAIRKPSLLPVRMLYDSATNNRRIHQAKNNKTLALARV